MKKLSIIFLSVILSLNLLAQQSEVIQLSAQEQPNPEVKWVNPDLPDISGLSHNVLNSTALGHDVGYVVWTPPGYGSSKNKKYPVLYFLHGSGGNEVKDAAGFTDWVIKAINDKTLPPSIVVFPNGGRSGYRGGVEQMIVEELIPEVDKNYRTLAKMNSRAIAGFSMGGGGAFYLATKHPELFCAVASMGGGFRNTDGQMDPFIEKALPIWGKNNAVFFMVNGDQDRPEAFQEFSLILKEHGIKNEVLILEDANHNLGKHYYPRSTPQLLAFIGYRIKK